MSSKKLFFLFSLLYGLTNTTLPAETTPSTCTQPARLSPERLQAAEKMLFPTGLLSPDEYKFQQERRKKFPLLPRTTSSHYHATSTNNSHFGLPSYVLLLTPRKPIPQPQRPTSRRASQKTSAVTVEVFVPGGLNNLDSTFFQRLSAKRAQRAEEDHESFEIVSMPTTNERNETESTTAPTTTPFFPSVFNPISLIWSRWYGSN